jgi:ribonuclease VapC
VEYLLVTGAAKVAEATLLMDKFREQGLVIQAFKAAHASIAADAGGVLTVLDLMVCAFARNYGEPVLCTGKDFATTDIALHAASRSF